MAGRAEADASSFMESGSVLWEVNGQDLSKDGSCPFFMKYRRFEKALYFGFHLGYTVGVSLSFALDLLTGRSNTGRSRSDCRIQRRERRSLPSGRLGAAG